jgi:enamine deaminase RidA (YjgF/YER057c/UK114 family)
MERRQHNPWTWQDEHGFSHAIEVRGGERIVYCAGQVSCDANGAPVAPGDMATQTAQALDNLETVLRSAGLGLADVVRLNYYVTDVPRFLTEANPVIVARLAAAGVQPASTLLGVAALAFDEFLIEIEATAVG